MKSADLKIGMDVAVYLGASRPNKDAPARKAKVISLGESVDYSRRTGGTRVHFYSTEDDSKLEEYDEQALALLPPRPENYIELSWEEKTKWIALRDEAHRLANSQRVVKNQRILMPWDEYKAHQTELGVKIAEARKAQQEKQAQQEAEENEILESLAIIGFPVNDQGIVFRRTYNGSLHLSLDGVETIKAFIEFVKNARAADPASMS